MNEIVSRMSLACLVPDTQNRDPEWRVHMHTHACMREESQPREDNAVTPRPGDCHLLGNQQDLILSRNDPCVAIVSVLL